MMQGVFSVKSGKPLLQLEPRIQPPQASLASAVYAQNVYAIFEPTSVERVAHSCAQRLMKQTESSVLISLRATIGGIDDPQGALVLCGGQVARLDDAKPVVLTSFCLEPNFDAVHARRLRSLTLPLVGATHYAFANVSSLGKKEDSVLLKAEMTDQDRLSACDVLGQDFALPRLVLLRLENRAPVTLAMLLRERSARPRRVAEVSDDNNNESADDSNDEQLSFEETRTRRRNEWHEALLEMRAFRVKCIVFGPLSKQTLLAQSSRIDLPFAPLEEPLDALTWRNATTAIGARNEPPPLWPYMIVAPDFLVQPPPVVVAEPIAPVEESPIVNVPINVDDEPPPPPLPVHYPPSPVHFEVIDLTGDSTDEPPVAVATAAVVAYDPLRHFARYVRLAELTIYEVETYARARLHWHILRLSEHERANSAVGGDDEWLERSAFSRRTRYPERSGAQRALLRMLSAAAVQREEHHEAIGMGILALVAAPSAALRENFLYLEALAIEAHSCAERETIDQEVAARLELIERFWTLCDPVVYSSTSVSTLERVFASIATDWQSGLG